VGPGHITVTPKSLTLSTTGDAKVEGSVIVGNTGSGPLHVTISGPKHNPPFAIESGDFIVGPHATVTNTITYSPTKKGTNKDRLSITSDDPSQKKPIKVKLKGDSD
jgi:hypothetical protein